MIYNISPEFFHPIFTDVLISCTNVYSGFNTTTYVNGKNNISIATNTKTNAIKITDVNITTVFDVNNDTNIRLNAEVIIIIAIIPKIIVISKYFKNGFNPTKHSENLTLVFVFFIFCKN